MATYHAGKRIQGGTVGTTFSDDFSSTTGWTAVASIVKVIPPALHFDGQRESIEGVGYDLGAGNVSDTKWVLRAKYDVTAEDHTGLTSGNLVYFGLSDVNQGTGVASNQDFIGLGAIVSSGTYKYHPCEAVNQNLLVSENNSPFAHLPVVETIYVEIIRISSTSYSVELFSDPSYSTSIEKETDTCDANTDNLRYIKCVCGYGAQTGLGNLYQGNIYDLEFYNNVSSVAEANSKFQLGSRWEQTDTRTIYHKDDEYKVHTFTTTGQTFNVTGSGDVEYLVVAGGAGGGHGGSHEPGGGGGAGGFRTGIGHAVTAQNYAITVGAGGAGSLTASANGANGSDSIFGTVTSNGGGGAASGTAASGHASNGGSGGGGSAITGSHIGGLGTSGQGFTGGTGFRAPDYEGGGGGGAGEVGESPISGASELETVEADLMQQDMDLVAEVEIIELLVMQMVVMVQQEL